MKRLLLAALRVFLPADWGPDIVGDLDEAHARRRRRRGRLRAGIWLAGQVVAFALRFTIERARGLLPGRGLLEVASSLGRDVRLTVRSLRRAPLFVGAVVLTLGAGIGATATVLTVVRTVLLEALPYPEADRLVVLDPNPWTPAPIAVDLAGRAGSLEEVAGYYPRTFTVAGDEPVQLDGAVVTPNLLPLLGAEVVVGRGFGPSELPGPPRRAALLGHGLWQRRYGSDPAVVGRTIRLDGIPHTVVGVVEEGFRQLTPRTGEPALWTAAPLDRLGADVLPEGSRPWAIPLARMARGVTTEMAQQELDAATAAWLERNPEVEASERWNLRWTDLRSRMVRDARGPLLLLQGAVGLLLLLACVNVANLLLARLRGRHGELAVRTALGASRGRIARELLVESAVLAAAGGTLGLAVAAGAIDLVVALAPRDIPRIDAVSLDPGAALLTGAIAVGAALLFGTVPGLVAASRDPRSGLSAAGRSPSATRSSHRLGRALVVAQVTLTLVLVVGAGLLVRSFVSLSTRDPGFRTAGVLVVSLSVPEDRHGTVPLLERYQHRLLERIRAVPGVDAVGLANHLPLRRGDAIRSYVVEGEATPREAEYGVVSPGYFETLDIPLVRGRGFDDADRRGAPRVAVVDRAMSREAWPGEDPVGRRFRFVDDEEWITVVGVSATIRGSGLEAPPGPGFHLPYRQRPETPVELAVGKEMVLLVRTEASPSAVGGSLRRAVHDVDPGQPVPGIERLGAVLTRSTAPHRFRTVLLLTFALLALVLATAGVYGVVANLLAEREREFGIRRALGATDGDIARTILGWGLRLGAAGVLLGLAGVAATGHVLSSLLVGVEPTDPLSLGLGVLVVLGATAAACLVPAWRATRIAAPLGVGDEGGG